MIINGKEGSVRMTDQFYHTRMWCVVDLKPDRTQVGRFILSYSYTQRFNY